MMTIKSQVWIETAIYTLIGLTIFLFFWFAIFGMGICHAQTQTGYRVTAGVDVGNNSKVKTSSPCSCSFGDFS